MSTAKFKVGSRVIIARPEAGQEDLKGRLALVVAGNRKCLTEDKRWVEGYIIFVDGHGTKPFVAPGCELDSADEEMAA